MKHSKLYGILGIIVIVGIVAAFWYAQKKQSIIRQQEEQAEANPTTLPPAPSMPDFVPPVDASSTPNAE